MALHRLVSSSRVRKKESFTVGGRGDSLRQRHLAPPRHGDLCRGWRAALGSGMVLFAIDARRNRGETRVALRWGGSPR